MQSTYAMTPKESVGLNLGLSALKYKSQWWKPAYHYFKEDLWSVTSGVLMEEFIHSRVVNFQREMLLTKEISFFRRSLFLLPDLEVHIYFSITSLLILKIDDELQDVP